jgi:hypothetical protein
MLRRRGGQPLDLDTLWETFQADREAHDREILGR